ncbi:MAG: hypothetical protein H0X61_15730 [Acidimicrobiia bacterium]|nr:hypothetical protein [Acidimicrobiia bacterium]
MQPRDQHDLTGRVRRLIGVYDADGTVLGELSYAVGRVLGQTHCSLCDITHGAFRGRPEWKASRSSLGVPFDTYHRNDQPDAVRKATGGTTPVVVAETTSGEILVLLGEAELAACGASPPRLMTAITDALDLNSGPAVVLEPT